MIWLQEIQSRMIQMDTYESLHINISQTARRILSSSEKNKRRERVSPTQREELYLYMIVWLQLWLSFLNYSRSPEINGMIDGFQN